MSPFRCPLAIREDTADFNNACASNLPIAGASSRSTTIDNVKDGDSDYKAAKAARLARKIQLCPWIAENYGQIDDSETDELEPVGPGEVAVMLVSPSWL